MVQQRHDWLFKCPACGFLAADLEPQIQADRPEGVDETVRIKSLEPLRVKNFIRVLDHLGKYRSGGRLLDVGCAHGWFLEEAVRRGYDAVGLEPDIAVRDMTVSRGLKAWSGFFPDDIPAGETFDVIVFNDVLEHIPDVTSAVEACNRLLRPGGHLILNIPDSRGFFYRLAEVLDAVGVKGPLERMWQVHFPSPHLSYFTPDQLVQLTGKHGFTERDRSVLPSVSRGGLWSRFRCDKTVPLPSAAAMFVVVTAISPVLSLVPADISLQVFEKR
jgi:SAM-dependent methyltransferase